MKEISLSLAHLAFVVKEISLSLAHLTFVCERDQFVVSTSSLPSAINIVNNNNNNNVENRDLNMYFTLHQCKSYAVDS